MEQTRRLLEIMARLRDPVGGCPWDLQQDFASLVPYTLEEAYEVADAIEREDWQDLRDELGDLLLQVAFHSQLAEERALFDFESVARAICEKLVRRHPHVFEAVQFQSDAERQHFWENSKLAERREKGGEVHQEGALDGVASSLPALMHAQKIQKRAARHGFDWSSAAPVFDKVVEELDETREALACGEQAQIEEEVGDLLFGVVNLARHLGVDAESALRASTRKFVRRFGFVEQSLARQGRGVASADAEELDGLWNLAKQAER
jgi:nucleoside triphosphate diphosphatase